MTEDTRNLMPVFDAALEAMGVEVNQEQYSHEDLRKAQAALRYIDNLIEDNLYENEQEDDDATG